MDVYVLNTSFEIIAIIDNYKSFIWTDRYYLCGDFELVTYATANDFTYLKTGYYLKIKDSDRLMIIEDFKLECKSEDGDLLTVKGRSLESILDRRVINSTQTIDASTFEQFCYTLLRNNFLWDDGNVRKYRMIENMAMHRHVFGDSEVNDPDKHPLVMCDEGVTNLQTISMLGDNIYDAITKQSSNSGYGFKITVQPGHIFKYSGNNYGEWVPENHGEAISKMPNIFLFECYAGTDRTSDQNKYPRVIFSPKFDNILSTNYSMTTSGYKNVAVVSGKSLTYEDAVDTSVQTTGSTKRGETIKTPSGLDLREVYVDGTNEPTTKDDDAGNQVQINYQEQWDDLSMKGILELLNHRTSEAMDGEIDITMYKPNKDFFLGDLVEVKDNYGHVMKCQITEIIHSVDENGYSVYPTYESVS